MAVHVGELTSEVTTEPEPSAESGSEAAAWQQVEQTRAALARAARDRARTSAEGYED